MSSGYGYGYGYEYEENQFRYVDSTLRYVECACRIAFRGLGDATLLLKVEI